MGVRRPHNCRCCGKYIDGVKYNPYNITFEHYECKDDDKKMCLNCAETFVKRGNRCKGGAWEVREVMAG